MPKKKEVSKTFSINFDDDEYDQMEFIMDFLFMKKKTDVFRFMLRHVYNACINGDIDEQ